MDSFQYEEFAYLKKFAQEGDFLLEVCKRQMRALWTAYCLHNSLDTDTNDYDAQLMELWDHLKTTGDECWKDKYGRRAVSFAEFDMYMCEDLV